MTIPCSKYPIKKSHCDRQRVLPATISPKEDEIKDDQSIKQVIKDNEKLTFDRYYEIENKKATGQIIASASPLAVIAVIFYALTFVGGQIDKQNTKIDEFSAKIDTSNALLREDFRDAFKGIADMINRNDLRIDQLYFKNK